MFLQEESTKPEQDEDVAVVDQEADVTEDNNSTLKSDEADDDDNEIFSYRSAF